MLFERRFRTVFGALALLGSLATGVAFGADWKSLHGHVPAVVARLNPLGRVAATNQLRLAIGVPLRDPAGLGKFLAQLYDPASTNYHHYLTPEGFADRFGPAEQDYEAVKQFARTNGLAVGTTYNSRLVLEVTGPAAAVEKALHITLHTYQHPTESRQFFAPDVEPSVPVNLPVADIQGLSDYSKPHPRLLKRTTKSFKPESGSAPDSSGEFFGNDYRNAYAPGVTLTGAGQSVGLLEFDGYYARDIAAYAQLAGNGRSNILVQPVLIDGFNGTVYDPTPIENSGSAEVSLDIEMAMAMAPGLKAIYSFETDNGTPNELLSTMAASNTVKNLSCSWGWSGPDGTTTEAIFMQMASQGQSFFNASGDLDAFTSPATTSADGVDNPAFEGSPSDDTWVTEVGGTALVMNGAGASYASESVWNDGGGTGSSGGISGYFTIPWWQTNTSMALNGGSTVWRNIPDVSAQAEEDDFIIYGNLGSTIKSSDEDGWGGTSFAAPQWAGFMALVNQQAAASGKPSAGFINPAIYALAAGSSYATCFHDVTTGNNTWPGSPTLFKAMTGYDLCTGLGTPNGVGLINALSGPSDPLGVSPLTGYAFNGPSSGPFNPSSGILQLTNSSGAALNWSLINTSAWLKADFTSGTLAAYAATSFNLSLTAVASTLALGSYSTTVTCSNQTSHVVQRLPLTLQVYQPLSVSSAKGFTAVGPVGGPFTSASQSFVLTNLGNSALNWSLINTSSWLTVSSASGTLAADGSASVTVGLSSVAGTLAAGIFNSSLVVTNSLGVVAALPFSLLIGQPIIQNGGFETGSFINWTLSGNTASTYVTSGGVNYTHSGTYSALLGPPYSPGYLTQNLTTTAGQNYVLSLWLRNPTGSTPNQFLVQWNGEIIFYQANITNTAWTNLQFVVTAPASVTPLQIGFQDDPDYFGLDDVNVTPLASVSFKAATRAAANFQLAWNTSAGAVYQIQYATNLLQPNWFNLGGAITAQTNTLTMTDTNALKSSPQRFYRLVVVTSQ